MKKEYTIKEFADRLSVSTRTVERYLQGLYTKENNKVIIPLDVADLIEVRHKHRQKSDTSPTEEFDIIEGFTNEEYQEFQKRLIEYPILQKDLEYHRRSAESHQRQMELILRNLEQRNFIEASDKKLKE